METKPVPLLSIDVGIKNLAVCLLEGDHIRMWRVINLNYDKDPCHAIMNSFGDIPPEATVIIERQMTRKMTNIQCYLEMYFRMKGHKSVIIYSPKHKLAGTNSGTGRGMYSARKKAAVELCKEWLEAHPQEGGESEKAWKEAKKRDDLADTLCQALAFQQNPVTDPTTVDKMVNARKPTARQDATGKYSKSNIKYLLQQMNRQTTIDGGTALPVVGKKLEKCVLKFWPNLEACMEELGLGKS